MRGTFFGVGLFRMQRHLLGLIAATCLIGAVSLWLFQSMAVAGSHLAFFLLRIGLVLGVIWLAFPQASRILQNTSRMMLSLILGGIVLIAVRPMLIPYVLIALVIGWLLSNRINPQAILKSFGGGSQRRSRRSTTVEGRASRPEKKDS